MSSYIFTPLTLSFFILLPFFSRTLSPLLFSYSASLAQEKEEEVLGSPASARPASSAFCNNESRSIPSSIQKDMFN